MSSNPDPTIDTDQTRPARHEKIAGVLKDPVLKGVYALMTPVENDDRRNVLTRHVLIRNCAHIASLSGTGRMSGKFGRGPRHDLGDYVFRFAPRERSKTVTRRATTSRRAEMAAPWPFAS